MGDVADGSPWVILASASPRRRELLGRIGVTFDVMVSEAEEVTEETEPVEVVKALARAKARAVAAQFSAEEPAVVPLAGTSGQSVSKRLGAGQSILVLGADTIVVLDGKILGKPHSKAEAWQMLRSLSGRTHEVYTGVCGIYLAGAFDKCFSEDTEESAESFAGKAKARPEAFAESFAEEGSVWPGAFEKCFAEETKVSVAELSEDEIAAYIASGEPFDKAGGYGIQGLFARHVTGIAGDYFNVVGFPLHRVYREFFQ